MGNKINRKKRSKRRYLMNIRENIKKLHAFRAIQRSRDRKENILVDNLVIDESKYEPGPANIVLSSSSAPQVPQLDISSSSAPQVPQLDKSSSSAPQVPQLDRSSSSAPQVPRLDKSSSVRKKHVAKNIDLIISAPDYNPIGSLDKDNFTVRRLRRSQRKVIPANSEEHTSTKIIISTHMRPTAGHKSPLQKVEGIYHAGQKEEI